VRVHPLRGFGSGGLLCLFEGVYRLEYGFGFICLHCGLFTGSAVVLALLYRMAFPSAVLHNLLLGIMVENRRHLKIRDLRGRATARVL
jgi:hypothetical protein